MGCIYPPGLGPAQEPLVLMELISVILAQNRFLCRQAAQWDLGYTWLPADVVALGGGTERRHIWDL